MKIKSKYIILSLCCSLFSFGLSAKYNTLNSSQDVLAEALEEQDSINQSEYSTRVPVAFGTQKKEHQTISSFTISGEDLLKSRSSNLMIALQGKLPGLNILQSDGEPGKESFSGQIRGYNSGVNNSVLFLIDGIERSPYGVDPNEVESVTVLKDGAATAMYGMRGSGGVVLINTKKGVNGKSKVSVSVDQSFQSPTFLPDFVSAYDYAQMYNQRVANDQTGTAYTDEELEHYRTGDNQAFYPTRDMLDDFVKDYSQMTRANVNFQGGNDMMRFFTSIGYLHQNGLFENVPFETYSYDAESKSDRFNFRTNLDMKVNETLDAWIYVGGFIDNANSPNEATTTILRKLYETPNNAYNDLTPSGEVQAKTNGLTYLNKESVFGMLNRTGSSLRNETRVGNIIGARQNLNMLTTGLSATGQVSFDIFSRKTQTRKRNYESYEVKPVADSLDYVQIPNTNNSSLTDGVSRFFYYMYNFRGTIDYQREFGDHYVSGTILGESQMEQQQALLPTYFIALAGRANYAYKNTYLAEINMAYQGSEQFAKGKRYGLFPSLSLGWVASNESFLKDNDILSFLKLRASIGQNGNSVYNYGNSNQYLYQSSWNTNATENQIGNEDFTWETSTKANLGVDIEFLKSITLGVDVFYNDNTNLIVTDLSSIPPGISGLNTGTLPPANIGYGTNKGFEVSLTYAKTFNSGLGVLFSGHVSGSKDQIDYVNELPYITTGNEAYAYANRVEGYALGQSWGYVSDGLFDDDADVQAWYDQSSLNPNGGAPSPGDIRYKDLTNDGIVNEKDVAPLEILNRPSYFFGITTQLNYKGFDLYAAFIGVGDRNIRLSGIGRASNNDNFTEYMKKAWTPENKTSNAYPRLLSQGSNNIYSDYWIENGAFIRLKNVELGYTLPKTIGNGNLRIYVNALNPLVWHHLPNNDFDPETAGGNNYSYPIIKSYNIGVNLKF